jgi:hypothetical protein
VPGRVVRPEALVTDRSGWTILGYTMRFLHGATVLMRYTERSFRQAGVSHATVVALFRDLHQTLGALHRAGVVTSCGVRMARRCCTERWIHRCTTGSVVTRRCWGRTDR